MRFKPRVLFSLVILIFFIVFVSQARGWKLQARLYPWTIGIPMIFLSLLYIFNDLSGRNEKKEQSQTEKAPVDFQFSQGLDKDTIRRRTINIFCWIFGFFAGIWLIGFTYMVPLFVFLYLKLQSQESWKLSLALTAGAWLIFWGLFDYLLKLPFPEGQAIVWLGWS
jgi:hypothetical protein